MPTAGRRLAAALALLLLGACSGGEDGGAGPVPVASVSVTPPQVTVAVGAEAQLTAQTRSADGAVLTGRAVAWISANPQIASVSASGTVRGAATGSTSVTATSEGQTATVPVTVTPPPAAVIVVAPNPASVTVGSSVQLTATARDAANNALTGKTFLWASSNTAVAAVDQSGRVNALTAGTTNITASVDNVTGTSAVTVQPRPAVNVLVTPNPASVAVGGSLQLTASARDGSGAPIAGKTFVWNSSNTGVLNVDQTGRVTGVAVGSATVSAVVDNVTGIATVTVQPAPPIAITQITPASLLEGQPATLTGTGFGATPAANQVTVDGATAQVTQASSTSLQIVVPTFNCRPRRSGAVVVTVGGQSSLPVGAPLVPPGIVSLSVGQQLVLSGTSDRCIHFDAASQNERYVFGVHSISEVVSTVTGVTVNGVLPGGFTAAGPMLPPPPAALPGPQPSASDLALAERWTRHLEATVANYERERVLLQPLADRFGALARAPAASAPTVPGTVQEGDQLTVRFPAFGGNTCTEFTNISVRVRKMSARGIFVEDVANTAQLPQSVYDQAASDFVQLYDIDVDHFGAPGDIDANQRVVIVVSREVNRLTSPPLGFVSFGNLFPTTQCPASNEGEFFFMRAADPTGEYTAGAYTVTDVAEDFPNLLAHELAHVIQGARRTAVGGQFMTSWLAEGLATAAQEVAGFQILNMQNGLNYGRTRVFASLGADPRAFFSYMADLMAYFGYDFAGSHRANAPEECSWVGSTGAGGNPGPCAFATRLLYGVPWSLIKNAIDRYHGGNAGQKQILRAFSERVGPPGFSDLEAVLGRPITTLLADWAPMLYLDERFPAAGFQMANWNLRDLAAAYHSNAELMPRLRGFTNFADAFSVRAGSAAYYDVSGINRPAISFRFRDSLGNALPQFMIVWVVRVQ